MRDAGPACHGPGGPCRVLRLVVQASLPARPGCRSLAGFFTSRATIPRPIRP